MIGGVLAVQVIRSGQRARCANKQAGLTVVLSPQRRLITRYVGRACTIEGGDDGWVADILDFGVGETEIAENFPPGRHQPGRREFEADAAGFADIFYRGQSGPRGGPDLLIVDVDVEGGRA